MKLSLPKSILSFDAILQHITPLRQCGKTCVSTNGCFDLLHAGHIRYLYDAALLGDILIVGINADQSVSRLKGPERPVQKELDRALIIGSLKMVDYVFIFSEPDPCTFLERLRPDIHVKGGDYMPEHLPETKVVEKYGGRIVIVPFSPGYSTTSLITAIQSK